MDRYVCRLCRDCRKGRLPRIGRKVQTGGSNKKTHEEMYRALLKNLEMQEVFKKSEIMVWECRNCGHVVVGTVALELCLVCNYSQAYFEVRLENY